MVWEILLILMLILANGLFAGAEIAIISARRGRLEQHAAAGSRRAQQALNLSREPNIFLPTVQISITLVGALGAAFGGRRIVDDLSDSLARLPWPIVASHADGIAFALFVACFTYVSLVLGELVPKRISLQRAEWLAMFVAPVMTFVGGVTRPLVWFLGFSTNLVLRLLRVDTTTPPTVSLEDIEHLIQTGTAEGLVEPVETKLALEALRLGDRTVRDVMRPRIDLDAIDVATPPEQVVGTVAMAGFSRLPVYERDLDHIIGFVQIKDLFRQHYLGWPIELRKLLHPALFVPETMALDRLLEAFQENRNQLAIVLNEYGGTEGMVTLEDVVEEMVGKLRYDHYRHEEQEFVQRDEKSWLVDGAVSIADLLDRLEMRDVELAQDRGFSTVGGLILNQLGHIPSVGDKAEWRGLQLEVVDMDGLRIDRVLVKKP
jgi:putative hemolysin